MKGNLILIHGGGPTAVINASLAGAIRQAKKEPGVDRILAAIGGTGGLMRGQVRDLTDITEEELALLERTPGSRAVLLPAPAATGMDNVLARFLIPDGGAPKVLRLGSQLLDALPCRILRYDDLDEAAELLARQAPLLPPAAPLPADFPPVPDSSASCARPSAGRPPAAEPVGDAGDSRTLWQQRPGLSCRQAGQSIFLTDSHGNHIFRLDGTGAVVWQLLSAPLSRDEALSLLAETFPDVPKTRIRHELKQLFQALFKARLIEKAHKSP